MDLMVKLPTAQATVSRRSFSEGGWTLTYIFLLKNYAEPASCRHTPALILIPNKY
jgi:hypothetical protein